MKMQDFSFNSFTELYDFLPAEQGEIVLILDEIIKETLPEIRSKLSWNVPFYFGRKNICFIWPGAVPWGKKTKPHVEFGFTRGHVLDDPENFLEMGQRKQVGLKIYNTADEIVHEEEIIRNLLLQAWQLDLRK